MADSLCEHNVDGLWYEYDPLLDISYSFFISGSFFTWDEYDSLFGIF